MGLAEALYQGSSFFEEDRKQARKELRQARAEVAEVKQASNQASKQAKAEGKAEEARRLLRLTLADRFPGLDAMPEIDQISELADLESLLIRHAMRAKNRAAIERTIVAAAQKPQ